MDLDITSSRRWAAITFDPSRYPLTRTTFLFPFWAPLAAVAPPGTVPTLSCAFIPAFTVSINTPDGTAGEYAERRLANDGCGSGGTGKCRPRLCLIEISVAFEAGCLPLLAGDLVDGITVLGFGEAQV